MARHINAAGLTLIKSFEGCRLTAYRCPAGVLTIGVGHTGPDVKEGQTLTEEQVDDLLRSDLAKFEAGVEKLVGDRPTTDNQFSALVSLAYNIGLSSLATSTVLKRHELKNYMGAANAFPLWNRAGGKILPGLTRRREAERRLYLS